MSKTGVTTYASETSITTSAIITTDTIGSWMAFSSFKKMKTVRFGLPRKTSELIMSSLISEFELFAIQRTGLCPAQRMFLSNMYGVDAIQPSVFFYIVSYGCLKL